MLPWDFLITRVNLFCCSTMLTYVFLFLTFQMLCFRGSLPLWKSFRNICRQSPTAPESQTWPSGNTSSPSWETQLTFSRFVSGRVYWETICWTFKVRSGKSAFIQYKHSCTFEGCLVDTEFSVWVQTYMTHFFIYIYMTLAEKRDNLLLTRSAEKCSFL